MLTPDWLPCALAPDTTPGAPDIRCRALPRERTLTRLTHTAPRIRAALSDSSPDALRSLALLENGDRRQ